jgi:hypothetical protein
VSRGQQQHRGYLVLFFDGEQEHHTSHSSGSRRVMVMKAVAELAGALNDAL